MNGNGTPEDPWVLKTPPGTSEFTIHRDDTAEPAELVCQVGLNRPGSGGGSVYWFPTPLGSACWAA